MSIINQNGVTAGIDRDSIRDMVTKIFMYTNQVAAAVEPKDGENGYVEFRIEN